MLPKANLFAVLKHLYVRKYGNRTRKFGGFGALDAVNLGNTEDLSLRPLLCI